MSQALRVLLQRLPRRGMVMAVAVCAAVVSACGASQPGALDVSDTALGQVVVDSAGHTLYAYTPETATDIACVSDCVHDWPPATTHGQVSAGPDLDASLLRVVTRMDGRRQLVYAGHPLYRWVGDRSTGDVRGQAIGGVWFVVRPSGHLLQVPPPQRPRFGGPARTTLTVISSAAGRIVADGSGAPLYAYRDDTATSVACAGIWCPTDWPPESVTGPVSTSGGITAPLATLQRADGLAQVVVNGHPLYRFSADLRPGDLRGLGVGGDWFVLRPDGALVGGRTSGMTSQAPAGEHGRIDLGGRRAQAAYLLDA